MEHMTLNDLMAENLDVWVNANQHFGFDIQIDGEDGGSLVDVKGVHPFAADSFADFCRRYLASYDKANKEDA